jgi:glutaredoxin
MSVLTVYTAPGCHLCEQAIEKLRELKAELSFELAECDITRQDSLHSLYFERIPVVTLDGEEICEYVVEERHLRERLLESRR